MNGFLKLNDKLIIREADNIVFSAKDMKIYKFNEKGFKILLLLKDNNLSLKDLLFKLSTNNQYSKEEIITIINKMIENSIIVKK